MGLNDTCIVIRGQIVRMKPLPFLSHSYAMLLQEESQCCPLFFKSQIENMAMNLRISKPSKLVKRSPDSTVLCDFCYMSGHLKYKCYYIHGYPSWYRLFGKPKPMPKFLASKCSLVAILLPMLQMKLVF